MLRSKKSKYSLRNTCVALVLLAVPNLTVAQRPGTKLVAIAYDVASTATNRVAVWLVVSNGVADAAMNGSKEKGPIHEPKTEA